MVFVYCNQAFFVILLNVKHIPKFNFFSVQCWVGSSQRRLSILFAPSAVGDFYSVLTTRRVIVSCRGFCLHADVFVIRRCMHIPRLIEQ